jgi:xanthine/uracil/vitamin C permease (AzgA family)
MPAGLVVYPIFKIVSGRIREVYNGTWILKEYIDGLLKPR